MSIKQAIEALETCLAMAGHGDFSTINAFDKARAALTALRSMPQGEEDESTRA